MKLSIQPPTAYQRFSFDFHIQSNCKVEALFPCNLSAFFLGQTQFSCPQIKTCLFGDHLLFFSCLKWLNLLVNAMFRGWLRDKKFSCSAEDAQEMGVSIPGSGRSPGEGNGNLLQYSCLGNPIDRGAWWAMVLGAAKGWTRLSARVHTHTDTHTHRHTDTHTSLKHKVAVGGAQTVRSLFFKLVWFGTGLCVTLGLGRILGGLEVLYGNQWCQAQHCWRDVRKMCFQSQGGLSGARIVGWHWQPPHPHPHPHCQASEEQHAGCPATLATLTNRQLSIFIPGLDSTSAITSSIDLFPLLPLSRCYL